MNELFVCALKNVLNHRKSNITGCLLKSCEQNFLRILSILLKVFLKVFSVYLKVFLYKILYKIILKNSLMQF